MKALLVDDHPLVLSGLQSVLQGISGDIRVVCVETARAARQQLAADPDFDLVLLDLQLGDSSGFDLLVEMRTGHPAMSIVVVSSSDANEDVTRAIYLGAVGFVPKKASNETLFEALSMVMSGGIYVPPMLLRSHALPGSASSANDGWGVPVGRAVAADAGNFRGSATSLGLTRRQTDVLELLLQGKSNKLIARALNLSVETIKDHVAAVLRTLKVSTRTQVVVAITEMSNRAALAPRRDPPFDDARH